MLLCGGKALLAQKIITIELISDGTTWIKWK